MRAIVLGYLINTIEFITFDIKIRKIYREIAKRNFIDVRRLVIFDVGANRGQSIRNLQKLSKDCSFYAFEANPILSSRLNRKFKAINVINEALTNRVGECEFFLSKLDLTSSLIMPNMESRRYTAKKKLIGNKDFERIIVSGNTLDKVIDKYEIERVNFLKIDVEGAESLVLAGAKQTLLEKRIDFIQLEIHSTDLRSELINDAQSIVLQSDFQLFATVKHKIGKFEDRIYVLKQDK
jgi:FkbM family methyltransferase